MEKNPKPIQLPPGFRFHPSDEELIVHYLRRKATKTPLPASIVADVELYKLNPWDLPEKSFFGDEEWYFFTPRDRKYPNGLRPNRMAASGYWKATGIDKPILTSCGSKVIGVKKALVFYIGRPPKGNKTDWIMHEYRLTESDHASSSWSNKKDNSMLLDEWVLCRVRQKTGSGMPFGNFPENRNSSSCSTVQKVDHIQCSPPNFDLVREKYSCQEDYCPLIPFLFGNSDHQEFPTSTDTAVSCISFEFVGEGNSHINKASSSSVCEDNFNMGNYNLRKRKLLGQGGLLVNGHEENIGHSTNKKKVNNRDYDQQQQKPASSSENDYAGDDSGMISSYHLAQNNHVDQSMMMYQDLIYNSFAFT